jgi:hypothetical protein
VASRWAQLHEVEVPQELFDQIERQQRLCCRVIEAKQELIAGEAARVRVAGGARWRRCAAACLCVTGWGPARRRPAEIRRVLLHKDEEYVKLLKRQGDEVDGLLGYMTQQ